MSNYNEITTAIAKSRDAARKRIASNKQVLFDVFDAKGVASATVTFDGSGDSGGITEVDLYRILKGKSEAVADYETILDEYVANVKIYAGMSFGPDGCCDMFDEGPVNVRGLIEAISYDALKAEHEGWENNDGAYGTVEFYSEDRSVSLQFYQRSTEFFECEF
jgi:hypothetical protein